MNLKETWKKFWNLLWRDNSWKGWAFSIIFLFIFIKFIFFPVLGLITGTDLPLAIVESCSMYHSGPDNEKGFGRWWKGHEAKYSNLEINKEEFENFRLRNGFNKGDILLIIKASPGKLKVGDIIIFNANQKNHLIHRIIAINIDTKTGERIFSTMGDNNNGQLSVEKNIKENQLVGKAVAEIAPLIGWGKLLFFELAKSESERGLCEEK